MIQAKELRIGNKFTYGKMTDIETVYQIIFDRMSGHLINGVIPERDCKPVLLTPKIIENYGFKQMKQPNEDFFCFDKFNIKIYDGVNWFLLGTVEIIVIDYLHQLQNICFAFTGKELIQNDKP